MPAIVVVRACLPALLLACTSTLSAQTPAYGRDPADTLRYHDVTEATVRTQGRRALARQRQEARVALAFTRGDTAHAWYEALMARAKEGNGYEELEIPGSEIRSTFALAVTPAGRVRTLATPTLPPPLEMEFDSVLVWQFVDFFPVLPAAPLRPGVEWTDADSVAPPGGLWTRSTRSRVVRDTVVAGMRAVVVETEARVRMRRASVVDEELSLRTELEGTERGRFVFAPVPGVLLRRERTGTLTGTETSLLVGDPPRAARLTREYTRVIELLPDSRP